jgi:putative monooxygenase ydhR
MHALVVTYGLNGRTACEHAEFSEALAPAFAAVPGLVSRTSLENPTAGRYGAFYVFETKGAFDRFVAGELYSATDGSPERANLAASDFSIPSRAARQRSGRDQETGPEEREGSS